MAFFMLVTLTVILALAVGVLVTLLITRRSVSDWQVHISETTQEWKRKDEAGEEREIVEPRTSDLQSVWRTERKEGSAYLKADELPNFDRRNDSTKK